MAIDKETLRRVVNQLSAMIIETVEEMGNTGTPCTAVYLALSNIGITMSQ